MGGLPTPPALGTVGAPKYNQPEPLLQQSFAERVEGLYTDRDLSRERSEVGDIVSHDERPLPSAYRRDESVEERRL